MEHDLYSILPLPEGASINDLLKKAFRKLALHYHPDKVMNKQYSNLSKSNKNNDDKEENSSGNDGTTSSRKNKNTSTLLHECEEHFKQICHAYSSVLSNPSSKAQQYDINHHCYLHYRPAPMNASCSTNSGSSSICKEGQGGDCCCEAEGGISSSSYQNRNHCSSSDDDHSKNNGSSSHCYYNNLKVILDDFFFR